MIHSMLASTQSIGYLVSLQSEVIINTLNHNYFCAAKLDSNRTIVFNNDKIRLLTIDNNRNITLGSWYNIVYDADNISIATLHSTRAIIFYRGTGGGPGYSCIIDVLPNGQLVFGTTFVVNSSNSAFASITALSSTRAITISYPGVCRVIDIAENGAITMGPLFNINSPASVYYTNIEAVSSTRSVIFYGTGATHGVKVIDIASDRTIAFGTELTISNQSREITECKKISPTRIIVPTLGNVIVADINLDKTITVRSNTNFIVTPEYPLAVASFNETTSIVFYRDSNGWGVAELFNIYSDGSIARINDKIKVTSTSTHNCKITIISETQALLSYNANNNLKVTLLSI